MRTEWKVRSGLKIFVTYTPKRFFLLLGRGGGVVVLNSHLDNRLRDNTWNGCQTGYCFISNNASLEKKIIQGTIAHRQCTKEPAKHQNYDAWKVQ